MLHSKKILVVILALALLPVMANATITRVIGLGGTDANYVVKDAFNPSVFPSTIKFYPHLAGGEFYSTNSWDFQKAYINYGFGEDKSTLQLSLDKVLDRRYYAQQRMGGVPSRLGLIYGRPLGDIKIGVALGYQSQGMERKAVGNVPKVENSFSLIQLGLGLTAVDDKLDAALNFEMPSFTFDSAGSKLENDGSMALGLHGRYWLEYAENHYWLVPNFRFKMMKDGVKAGNAKMSESTTNFKIGLGNNWSPVDDMLAVFELGFEVTSTKYEDTSVDPKLDVTESYNSLPYWRLGFESKIFSWLIGRFGAERMWVSESSDDKDLGEPSMSSTVTNTYLGATAHWNRLYLDLLVNPHFLQDGPYFVSGSGNSLTSRVSLKYAFGK